MTSERILPMFPLGTVLFPYAPLPLHVFEPRYRTMTRDLLDGDGELGIVLIERGHEVGGGDVRFAVATRARLVRAQPFPDGRFALLVVGVGRLRVVEWLPDDPYPRAEVADIGEEPAAPGVEALLVSADQRLRAVRELWSRLDPRATATAEDPVLSTADPVRGSYEAAAAAPLGPLDAQRLLECPGPGERLRMLVEMLDDEIVVLQRRLDAG